jgi:transcriptional regulator GlxA family with amidase domain
MMVDRGDAGVDRFDSAGAVPCGDDRVFQYYERLRTVREHVEAHLAEPIDLKTIARVVNLQPGSFSRFFRERVGVPFSLWVACRRVREAASLLRDKEHTIPEIVSAVGFGSERDCRRWFQCFVRMSPLQYRERVWPKGETPVRSNGVRRW